MSGLRTVRRALGLGLFTTLACGLLSGCGDEKTYRVSGKVSFKGQPIAEGRILFIPDNSKGNKGPAGSAEIKNGQYDTGASGGKGSVGGPMTIQIEAWDPAKKIDRPDKSALSSYTPIFPPYQTSADLPKSDSTKDFDVPAEALKGPAKKGLGSK
jgi:hypothetical protein